MEVRFRVSIDAEISALIERISQIQVRFLDAFSWNLGNVCGFRGFCSIFAAIYVVLVIIYCLKILFFSLGGVLCEI